MHNYTRYHAPSFGRRWTPASATAAALTLHLFFIFVFVFMLITGQAAQAQTYNVIHNFAGGEDGASPIAGLSRDRAGNLYGTTSGNIACCGTIFKLAPSGSGWIFTTLHVFGIGDGARPYARVTVGPDGGLYGTTYVGGGQGCSGLSGCGTIFRFGPSYCKNNFIDCPWTYTVLHRFSGGSDGALPLAAVSFDREGNLYGTTTQGGDGPCDYGCGVVYKLKRTSTGWTETILHSFTGGADGFFPMGEVIFDPAGNLYGTTAYGGKESFCCGTVFQMVASGSSWAKKIIHSFGADGDGVGPQTGLVLDGQGNLFGTTAGSSSSNTIFELTPDGGGWTETIIYRSPSWEFSPQATLALDETGNLYGSSAYSRDGAGNIFKLTRSIGSWTYTSLHDFGSGTDGYFPLSSVVMDATGKLYGTAYWGGTYGLGVVWEISP